MAPLSDHVQISITVDTVSIARASFGIPLILSANASFTESVRVYSDLAGLLNDFPDPSSPEALAATAIFSQNPRPTQVKVGRSPSKPTQKYSLSVSNVLDNTDYEIQVEGQGVTSTLVSINSGGGASDGSIVLALVAALQGVTGKNYTAAGATSPFTVTGDAAGDWFSLEVRDPTLLDIEQDHVDPGVVADLQAIQLIDNDWYALYTLYNSRAYAGAVAAWIETQKKIYAVDSNTTKSIQLAVASGNDLLDDLFDSTYSRTFGLWHQSPAEMASAAWLGRVLPFDPGSVTWKFKTLAGVVVSALTTTQRTNLRDRNANSYETVAGLPITAEGTMASSQFIDIIRGLDFIEDDMSKSVFEVLAAAAKVPFTDAGIALIENAVRGSLTRAISQGIIAEDPEPVVTVPLASEVSSTDKVNRILPDVKFTATLQGAIHKVIITGVVSV